MTDWASGEDEMEAFLSKHGGSSNAFTDCPVAAAFFLLIFLELGSSTGLTVVFLT